MIAFWAQKQQKTSNDDQTPILYSSRNDGIWPFMGRGGNREGHMTRTCISGRFETQKFLGTPKESLRDSLGQKIKWL